MIVQLVSDLHIEHRSYKWQQSPAADVVVIAGDMGPFYHCQDALGKLLKNISTRVILVAGNHDRYGTCSRLRADGHFEINRRMRAFIDQFPHVSLLNDECEVYNGVCFIGTPLYTDFSLYGDPEEATHAAAIGISDFTCIQVESDNDEHPKPRLIQPEDYIAAHNYARRFIAKAIAEHPETPTVVISHWLPSAQCIVPFFRQRKFLPLNPYFASDCEDLMGGQVKLWCYGHSHSPSDVRIKGTRVVANPRGYDSQENVHYNSQFIIEI
jgi:predicted phosphodiesterase